MAWRWSNKPWERKQASHRARARPSGRLWTRKGARPDRVADEGHEAPAVWPPFRVALRARDLMHRESYSMTTFASFRAKAGTPNGTDTSTTGSLPDKAHSPMQHSMAAGHFSSPMH